MHIIARNGNDIWLHKISLFGKPQAPTVQSEPYVPPPPPPPLKRKVIRQRTIVPAAKLVESAAAMLAEADEIEAEPESKPSMVVLLGLSLVDEEDGIKRTLKQWDAKGKKGLNKAEFRMHLRKKLGATSNEADHLFELWDADGGGTLDEDEVKTALSEAVAAAEAWRHAEETNPSRQRISMLRKRAALAEAAAEATGHAETLEQELEEISRRYDARADVQLGALLFRRRVKPGAVCHEWSTSRGVHAGELSKHEFRVAVRSLGLQQMSQADIDDVFDTYDADCGGARIRPERVPVLLPTLHVFSSENVCPRVLRNARSKVVPAGYLDQDEAREMIRGLQRVSEDAEHEKFSKAQAAAVARRAAHKMTSLVHAPLPELQPTEMKSAVSTEAPTTPPPKQGETTQLDGPGSSEDTGSIRSAFRMASGAIFSADRKQRQLNLRESRLATEQVMNAAVRRMQQHETARAWNAWSCFAKERMDSLNLARRAVNRLMQPALHRGWSTWTEWHATRCIALRKVAVAVRGLVMSAEIVAWRAWCDNVRSRALCLRALHAYTCLQRKRLSTAFVGWQRQQMLLAAERGLKDGNPCRALAYWLRANSRVSNCLRGLFT